MEKVYENVIQCYDREGLKDILLGAIQNEFEDGPALRPDDLAPIDEFHIRGRESTEELANLAGGLNGLEVLDVGCGLGGTARYLASTFDCRVTGVDITAAYISMAEKFSSMVDLTDKTSFHETSALELPYPDEQFDIAWMEHVQMNIPSKNQLAREITRVLRPGGKWVFHEIFSDSGADLHMPVPWADVDSGSFLVSPEDFRRTLEESGLEVIRWENVTQASLKWFDNVTQKLSESGPPPLGLHLLMGDAAQTKLGNVGKNLRDNRITVRQAVCRKK